MALLLHQPAEAQANSKAVSNVSVSSPNPGGLSITWDAPSDAVTSDPGTDDTYALGDTIEVGLTLEGVAPYAPAMGGK